MRDEIEATLNYYFNREDLTKEQQYQLDVLIDSCTEKIMKVIRGII